MKLYRLVRSWQIEDVDDDDLVTPLQAARYLQVTVSMVMRWMDSGMLPCYSVADESIVGRARIRRYTTRQAVERLMAARGVAVRA